MNACCRGFLTEAEQQFSARVAKRDLRRYQRKGPDLTTRLLRDGLLAASQTRGTLLDIGTGIGALAFELLAAGIHRALAVDASAPYIDTGRSEALRRSLQERIRWHHGDVVLLADEIEPADVVTLDRVVCCYASVEPLLLAATRHAGRCIALSYPRDRWYVRGTMWLDNAVRRIKGVSFRTFLHPPEAMEVLVCSQGFSRLSRSTSLVWCADVYARSGAA